MNIIFCCGENLHDRENNVHFDVVKKQLEHSLFHLPSNDFSSIIYKDYDLVFFACPNGTVMKAYSDFKDEEVKIIDLAADFRLDDEKIWGEYYGEKHICPNLLSKTNFQILIPT